MRTTPKLKLAAVAALTALLAPAAFAQASNVQVYGRVDLGLRKVTSEKLAVEPGSGNRLGFKGVEDLGSGLSAFFHMEHRFNADTGASQDPFWTDVSVVGLRGGFGEVKLGRQASPIDMATGGGYEVYDGDTVGASFSRAGAGETKWANSVMYTTPALGPVSLAVGSSLKESTGAEANSYGAALTYLAGPIKASVALQQNHDKSDSVGFGLKYSGTGWRIYGTAARTKDIGGDDGAKQTDLQLSGGFDVGTGELRALFNHSKLDDVKTRKFSVGYFYPLSKRTFLYTDVARQKTDDQKSRNGIDFGMRHDF
ncbi:porin [Eleftheria terrae]|uniref:porin n=1 Tax=Eleftheria terrae TaxID=1597781 RepID=UPI00263BA847|nr:porin [Eleftheria terrae]WKB51282.1 porin [Eleftheria terrae]